MIDLDGDLNENRPRISVIGVGGSGGNAVANMIRNEVGGVEFVVANTDAQALRASPACRIVQLGRGVTEGLGAGSRPEIGKAAAEESLPEIVAALEGMHMCFIAAGMGGGTGSGAAPVIAKAARDLGILTVGVVTKPFGFEGARRARIAEAALEELRRHVDTLIVIPNQNLFRIADAATTFKAAFDLADDVLQQGIRGITDLMVMPGLINLDFADIRAVMTGMGQAMMGTGEASGEGRAMRAADQAISNPLLDHPLRGAKGLIISIIGGEDLRLMEVDEAASYIKDMVDPEADIIWGSAFDPALEGRIRVSVVATGIEPAATTAFPAPTLFSAPPPFLLAEARPVGAESTLPSVTEDRVSLSGEQELLFRGPLAQPGVAETWAKPLRAIDPAGWADEEMEPDADVAQDQLPLDAPDSFAARRHPARLAFRAQDACLENDLRGPSLFERIAAMARGAGRAQGAEHPSPVELAEDRLDVRVA